MKIQSFTEVFVPGGYPRLTYNRRDKLNLESRLGQIRHNLCKLEAVTGHTKSGKTVLVRSVIDRENCVWIDGGVVQSENDFWSSIIDQLDLFSDKENLKEQQSSADLSATGTAGANFLVAKGSAGVEAGYGNMRGQSESLSRSVTPAITALHGLRQGEKPIVVDDFHYLDRELQGRIVRALKPLIFDGLPVVIIAIPHRRYDAMKVEREMTGRVFQVQIPQWEIDELTFIPKTGFKLLRGVISDAMCEDLAEAAIGSPHLMQEFCREICEPHQVQNDFDGRSVDLEKCDLHGIYRHSAENIGRPIFEKIARGPRQRTDRKQRSLKDGRKVDIYGLILRAMASLKPGLITLEYEELRSGIKEVAGQEIPQLHEVSRVLKHMSEISASDASSTPVIEFDDDEKLLHITDPFFAFYLRWGNMDRAL